MTEQTRLSEIQVSFETAEIGSAFSHLESHSVSHAMIVHVKITMQHPPMISDITAPVPKRHAPLLYTLRCIADLAGLSPEMMIRGQTWLTRSVVSPKSGRRAGKDVRRPGDMAGFLQV